MDVRIGLSRIAEHRRIDAFELWCWRRLLRVPWPARRSNQSILKQVSPEYSLEGLMLKLKLKYFGHLMGRTDSSEKTMMMGKIMKAGGEGDNRGWDNWMASQTQWTWVWASFRSWWWTRKPGVLQSMGLQRVGHNWKPELNWLFKMLVKLKFNHAIAQIFCVYGYKTEKAMAPCSSTLAWKIPLMEDPGRLQSMGSLRVGHDFAISL